MPGKHCFEISFGRILALCKGLLILCSSTHVSNPLYGSPTTVNSPNAMMQDDGWQATLSHGREGRPRFIYLAEVDQADRACLDRGLVLCG